MSITDNMESSTDTAAAAAEPVKSEDTTMTNEQQSPAPTTNDSISAPLKSEEATTSSSSADAAPLKSEETTAPIKSEEPMDNEELSEEIDEEDALFTSLEHDLETEERTHQNDAQPHSAIEAPKLLQAALAKGEVGVDESEAESEEEHKKASSPEKKEEKKEEEEGNHNVHHRVSTKKRVRERFLLMLSLGYNFVVLV